LENLYLSGSTLLQIIASTEQDRKRTFAARYASARDSNKPGFFDYLAGAADKVGISSLTHDVVKVRNSLIHKGTLRGSTFVEQLDASYPIAEAMNWIDNYIYAVLGLGKVPLSRHSATDYAYRLNSFSF